MKLSALCRLAASSLCAAAAWMTVSCASPALDGQISATPPLASVRARLRGPVSVLYSGLNPGVNVRIPKTATEVVFGASPASYHNPNLRGQKGDDTGMMMYLPFYFSGVIVQAAAASVFSPVLAAAGTSPETARERIARVQQAVAGTRWDNVVRGAISTRWRSAGGGAFERTAVLAEAHFDAKRNPGTLAGLAAAGSRTVLDLLVSGPCLTNPGGSALSPCTTIWFRVVDAKSGAVLHRGSVRAISRESRSLASWASDDGVLLCRELEASAQRAAAELAEVLLRK